MQGTSVLEVPFTRLLEVLPLTTLSHSQPQQSPPRPVRAPSREGSIAERGCPNSFSLGLYWENTFPAKVWVFHGEQKHPIFGDFKAL